MRWLNRVIALSAAALVLLGAPAVPAIGQPVDVTVTIPAPAGAGATEISNAQFRWGINHEVGSAAFFGDCNFLSAGRAGDAGGSRVWTDADVGALFRSTDGAVRIEKPVGTQFHPMRWADRCTDAEGARLSTASMTGSGVQAVMDSGRGVVDLASGTATIEWTGSVSIVFYGGLTYWWFSDPVLTINADGTGNVTAVAGGFATSQEDSSRWEALPEARIVLAELSGATLTADGLATDPHYRGIEVSTPPVLFLRCAKARHGDHSRSPSSTIRSAPGRAPIGIPPAEPGTQPRWQPRCISAMTQPSPFPTPGTASSPGVAAMTCPS